MSATDDRAFADVRPLFDAWHTAQRADRAPALPDKITPAMRDARVGRMVETVERALDTVRAKHPGFGPESPLEADLLDALLRVWLDGLRHHATEAKPYLAQLLGAYLDHAPAADLPAFGRFSAFLRSRTYPDATDD